MEWLKEGLLLQMKRLGHVNAAKVHAEAWSILFVSVTPFSFFSSHLGTGQGGRCRINQAHWCEVYGRTQDLG